MAEYRKLDRRFWSDPKTIDLNDKQRLIFIYAVTGIEACTRTKISGIYELPRSVFQNIPFCYSLPEIDEIFDYFNTKKPCLLEYCAENHMVFIKNFFKYNSHYKTNISGIIEDFEETFDKAPAFWAEFGQRYRSYFQKKVVPYLTDHLQIQFLERLFELHNEVNEHDFSKDSILLIKKKSQKSY